MKHLVLVLMIFCTLAQCAFLRQSFLRQKEIVTTRESVKRLAALTMEMFSAEDPPQGLAFWRAIGRNEPILDLWGNPFQMEILAGESQKLYLWISAGPDHQFGTRDDVKARVPYQKGSTLDLTQPGINEEGGLPSVDAK